MSLLEIQDPKKINQEIVVGIDFGTTNSLIGFSIDHKPFIIGDELGNIKSIINFNNDWQNDNCEIGNIDSAKISIRSIKRILGKTYAQVIEMPSIDTDLKKIIFEQDKQLMLKIADQVFSPIYLASLIFVKLKQIAEQTLEQPVHKAVVSVPAYFDNMQKSAVKAAANLAQIQVIRLINEPTAAGFAYRINYEQSSGQYLVYDFGGGTFDVSLLKIQDQITQVIGVKGDNMLGGDDIDHLVVNYLTTKYNTVVDIKTAQELKHSLSKTNAMATTTIVNNIELELSSHEYDTIAMPIITKTIDLTAQIIELGQNIKGIILVGGSSRIPLVKKMLARFNIPLLDNIDADKAIAFGAALQAENLSRSKSHVLIDVVALSLGIEVIGGLHEKIIFRNTPLPIQARRHFTTQVDNQTGIKIHILQGEREFATDCISLGSFELDDIPLMPAGVPKIEIDFLLDADGLLYVNANETSTGTSKEIILKTDRDLSQDKIDQMIATAMQNAKLDHENKLLKEEILRAENFLIQVEKIILKSELVNQNTSNQVSLAVNKLKAVIKTSNIKQIQQAVEDLDTLFSPICAKYFNTKISTLLRGNKISD